MEANWELKPEGQHAAAADASLAKAVNPVERLTQADHDRLVDECYQCKLCYNHCPYVPPHRFAIDFPKLLQRQKAGRVKRDGISFRDRMLAQVDLFDQSKLRNVH